MKANLNKNDGGSTKKPIPRLNASAPKTTSRNKKSKEDRPSKAELQARKNLAGRAAREDNKSNRNAISVEKKRQMKAKLDAAKLAKARAVPPRYPRTGSEPNNSSAKLPKAY